MEKIIVTEHFLTEEEINKALSIIKSKSWKFGYTSTDDNVLKKEDNIFIDNNYWIMDLFDETYFTEHILNIIEKHFSKKFKIHRNYANGQTYGQDGSFHKDVEHNENGNKYTFVLYFTKIPDKYVEAAGGHIFFKLPGLKYKICYEPIFNRGIIFPCDYEHKAHAFNRYVMDLRICVSWILEEIC